MWVKGIVDELRLDDLGKIIVMEHKSRKNHSLPSEAQKDTARLQVRALARIGLLNACCVSARQFTVENALIFLWRAQCCSHA